ncbi:hypothetical protein D9M68_897440 [compost metagenome]
MFRKGLSYWVAITGDDIENALWQPGFLQDLGKLERGARGELTRLYHHGAASAERIGQLLAEDHQWVVPGGNQCNGANRLAEYQSQLL